MERMNGDTRTFDSGVRCKASFWTVLLRPGEPLLVKVVVSVFHSFGFSSDVKEMALIEPSSSPVKKVGMASDRVLVR